MTKDFGIVGPLGLSVFLTWVRFLLLFLPTIVARRLRRWWKIFDDPVFSAFWRSIYLFIEFWVPFLGGFLVIRFLEFFQASVPLD
jgi:hypothetical protein